MKNPFSLNSYSQQNPMPTPMPTGEDVIRTRTCTQCNIIKPLTEYTKQKNVKSGLKAKCKSCIKENMREYNARKKAKKTTAISPISPISPSISPSNVLVTINYIMAIGQLSAERKIAIIKELVK